MWQGQFLGWWPLLTGEEENLTFLWIWHSEGLGFNVRASRLRFTYYTSRKSSLRFDEPRMRFLRISSAKPWASSVFIFSIAQSFTCKKLQGKRQKGNLDLLTVCNGYSNMIFILLCSWIYFIKYQTHESAAKTGYWNVNRKRYYQHSLIRLEYILNTKDSITGVSVARKICWGSYSTRSKPVALHPYSRGCKKLTLNAPLPAARLSPGK